MSGFLEIIKIFEIKDYKVVEQDFKKEEFVKIVAKIKKPVYHWWQLFNPFHTEVKEIVLMKQFLLWRDVETGNHSRTGVSNFLDSRLKPNAENEWRQSFLKEANELNPFK
jgi:hypothetical protein